MNQGDAISESALHPGAAPLRVPHFIIFGAAKSGTTWLHRALRQHPKIFMPPGETNFFSDPYYGDGNLCRLAKEFVGAERGVILGIKSPDYLGQPECAPRISDHLPDVKLIALLRNPVDRAISQYFHLVRSGRLEVTSPDEFFRSLLSGNISGRVENDILGQGRYAHNLERYWSALNEARVLILLSNSRENEQIYRKACEFLGVSGGTPPLDLDMPRNLGTYSDRALSALGALHRAHLIYDQETGAGTAREGVGSRVASLLLKVLSKASTATRLLGRDRPLGLSDEVRRALYAYYEPDIERLHEMTGVDLSSWQYDGQVESTRNTRDER